MLHKTRGIVLHNTKFSESSIVTKIYTRDFGMQSYLINGVRKGKGNIRPAHLLPLNLLDMVVYHKDGPGLQRVRELRCDPQLTDLPFDVIKNSIGMFISELLNQCLDGEESDHELFDFAESFICLLDMEKDNLSNHTLWFMVQLSRYLGFGPDKLRSDPGMIFNLEEGEFSAPGAVSAASMNQDNSSHFALMLHTPIEDLHNFRIPKNTRADLLDDLILFYQIHALHGRRLRSHEVLKTIFKT